MAAGQHGRVEAWHETDAVPARQAVGRGWRDGETAGRSSAPDNPAFISDEAEEQHYLDTLADETLDAQARADTRMELARHYERRQRYLDAAELYERNLWAGVRTPATYARLAAAYRAIGRNDLAEAALEQVRRNGGATQEARETPGERVRQAAVVGARAVAERGRGLLPQPRRSPRRGRVRSPAVSVEPVRRAVQASPTAALSAAREAAAASRRLAAPFLTGQAGHRTRFLSTVIIPIVLGVVVVTVLVMMSRTRTPAPPPTPAAAPAATLAPTAAPTPAVPAALSQPPATTRLAVAKVGADGLSLRRTASANGERIKVWPEGTEMVDLGQTTEQGGKTWKQVRDPAGNVGWAASDFLADPAASATAAGRPGPAPTAAPPLASGGLGLSRAEWEQSHGQPTRTSIFLEYDGGRLIVGLSGENVWHLERIWTPRDAVPLEAARNEAKAFLPADATLTGSIERGDGRTVDIYASPSLTARFGPTAWNGGKAGTFSIQYRYRSAEDRRVTSAMFRLGDVSF